MLEAPLAWSDLTYILYKRVTQTYTLQTDNRTKDENLMELEIRAAIKVMCFCVYEIYAKPF